ncbi:phosphohistidine phosphatase SixA [Geobacter hydrogenophilus]|uniref:Phosphohistidine phosphatase n=1 Tax=Geobacter hydrogenophilus TaxID=40983 RepID=A0A9W6LC74_9BACT|nr:phosphohistidine phosphatase SixA [Geobacter hydrogenophilus]MBT0894632.1 phosphohistidine phosphatase SixA [Geobacter hydrogenophilus]GLI37171.1 phosphohistidine phosphatase [Geobacter hydrogenophilus]
MKLYLIRHGEAVERSEEIREEDRWLTAAGRDGVRANVRRLAKKVAVPDVIVTSPLVRAVQTADILAEVLGFEGEVRVSQELAPGFSVEALFRLASACESPRSLAVVGHEPDLGRVLARLLGLEGALPFKKGAIVALKVAPAGSGTPARFRWLIHGGKKFSELP